MKTYDRFYVTINKSVNSQGKDATKGLNETLSPHLPGTGTVQLKNNTDYLRIDYYENRPVLMGPEGSTIKGKVSNKYKVAMFDDPLRSDFSGMCAISGGEFYLPNLACGPDYAGGPNGYRVSLIVIQLAYATDVVYNKWAYDGKTGNFTQDTLNARFLPYLIFSNLGTDSCTIEQYEKHYRMRGSIDTKLQVTFKDDTYTAIKINNPYDAKTNITLYNEATVENPHHDYIYTSGGNMSEEQTQTLYDGTKVYFSQELNCAIFQMDFKSPNDKYIASITQDSGYMIDNGGSVIAHGSVAELSDRAKNIIKASNIDCSLYADVLSNGPQQSIKLGVIYEGGSVTGSMFKITGRETGSLPSEYVLYIDDMNLIQHTESMYRNKGKTGSGSSGVGSLHNPENSFKSRDFAHSIVQNTPYTEKTFKDIDRDLSDVAPFYPFIKNKTFEFIENPLYNYDGGYLSYITQTRLGPASGGEDEGYHFNEPFAYTGKFKTTDTENGAMYKYTPFLMASNGEAYENDGVEMRISYNTSTKVLSVNQTISGKTTSNQLTLKTTDRVLIYARLPVELSGDRQPLLEQRKYKMKPSYEIIEYYDHETKQWKQASDDKKKVPKTMFLGIGAPINESDAQSPEVYAIADGTDTTGVEYDVNGNYTVLDMTDFIKDYGTITITPTTVSFNGDGNDYTTPLQFFVQNPGEKLQEAKVFPYTTVIDEKNTTIEGPRITGGSHSEKSAGIAKSNTISSVLSAPNDAMKKGGGVKLNGFKFPELMSIDENKYGVNSIDGAKNTVLTTNALGSGQDDLPEKSNSDGTTPSGSTYFALMGSTVVPLLGYVAPQKPRKLHRSKTTSGVTYGFYSKGGYQPEIGETCFVRPFEMNLDENQYYMATGYSRPQAVVNAYEDTRTIATALVVGDCDQTYSKPNTNQMPDYDVVVLAVDAPRFVKHTSRPGYYYVYNDNDFTAQLYGDGDGAIDIAANSKVELQLQYGGKYYFKVSGKTEESEWITFEDVWLEVTQTGTDQSLRRPIYRTSADCHGYFYMNDKGYYFKECNYTANQTKTFGYATANIKYILFDTDKNRIQAGKPVNDLPRTVTSSLYHDLTNNKGVSTYK